MKIDVTKERPEFKPVVVTITLESQQELRALQTLVWHTETVPTAIWKEWERTPRRSNGVYEGVTQQDVRQLLSALWQKVKGLG